MKKLTSLFLAILMLLGVMAGLDFSASADIYGDFEYSVSNNEITIKKYSGNKTDVIIPNEIDVYPVTKIGRLAFSGKTFIVSIVIPDSVKVIDNEAFYGCSNLESIIIPSSIKNIGSNAFKNCNIQNTFFKGTIYDWLDISFSDVVYDDWSEVYRCYPSNFHTKKLYINGELLTHLNIENIEIINPYAFFGCESITSVSTDEKLKFIGKYAFSDCVNLTDIIIPSDFNNEVPYINSEIYHMGFSGFSIESIGISKGSKGFSNEFLNLVKYTNISELSIPDSITYIPDAAFKDCTNLLSITIPESVTRIEYNAFSGCTNLIIKGYSNSYAQTFATLLGIPFIVIDSVEEHLHNYEAFTKKEATESESGIITYRCSVCGNVYTENTPILGAADNGWYQENGNSYYFNNGQYVTGWQEINDKTYFFSKAGVMQKGWVTVDGEDYYLDNGALHSEHNMIENIKSEATCSQSGSKTLTCSVCGISQNEIIPKLEHTPVLDEAAPATCTETGLTAGSHCSSCGEIIVAQKVVNATGHKYIGEETKAATKTSMGIMTYTCSECGDSYTEIIPKLPSKNGWIKENNNWYYYKTDVVQKGWLKDGGKWYYMDKTTGAMKTGWVSDGGKWYYMNAYGAMVTGWVKSGSTWYYMNSSGAMVTGWQKVGGTWYYFNSSGAMVTGWVKSGGSWYYMDSSGAMLANTSRRIGSKTYYFNSSGACTNP